MLKVDNVVKYYGDFLAVDGVSFEVKEGEIFGLLGVNGAGKTTIFRMIMGLLEPTSGNITYRGKPIDYTVTDEIGFLTEERSLLTKLTVKEQALFYGNLKGMNDQEILERLDYLLQRFMISEYKERKIKELSKGNQQKIQFIMSILNKPKLLILDEPFAGLDPMNVELFKEVIKELQSEGSIIIFSSHRMEHVELFCEKLTILVKGKAVIQGYLTDIKRDFRQKNIFIQGDVKKTELEKIEGVKKVIKNVNEFEVRVSDETKINNVFDYVKTCSNITKFEVREPSLNEIFIAKVGVKYEK
ncbi:MAG TPA: ATP-binding cassette domain-containing protein [Tenericutes bacterium]|jgi:ABC-2 type transport system ATP-binding protein|nr:ATP-binding cassette domain-containing protein [Mycoplasmatota bacterium]